MKERGEEVEIVTYSIREKERSGGAPRLRDRWLSKGCRNCEHVQSFSGVGSFCEKFSERKKIVFVLEGTICDFWEKQKSERKRFILRGLEIFFEAPQKEEVPNETSKT